MIAKKAETRWDRVNVQKPFGQSRGWLLQMALILLVPVFACAQICIPPSLGVPPAYQPPHWWDNSPAQPVYYQKLTDPRWQGAAAVSKTDGTKEINSFLALQDGTYLYLSWRNSGGLPLGSTGQNVVYVGYERASDGKPVIVKAELTTSSGIEAGGVGFVDPDAIELDPSGVLKTDLATPVNMADPAWVDDTTRVWITSNSYAVQMRIPLNELKLTAGTFKLWFEMLAGSPANPVTSFAWPRGSLIVEVPPAYNKMFPLPTASNAWETFKLSSGPSDLTCPAQGISLDQNKIATYNPSPHEILYKKSPALKPENVLFAKPTNNSGSTIDAGKLKATFRIANWGSQPNFSDWEVGVPIDQLWAKVPCVGADSNGAVGTTGDIGNGTTANSLNELQCKWTLSDAEILPFENGTRNSHSCVLVEMSDTVNPGLVYRNRSMWNNFDVRSASTFEKSAQITLKGLTPISPAGRDVYVYVETLNMPEKVSPQNETTITNNDVREGPLALKRAIAQGEVTSSVLSRMIAEGSVSDATLDAIIPTYIIHAYHDTGKTLTIGGVKRPVLNPQGSFGYRVTHAGDLSGWKNELLFDSGYTVDQLAPNFYRVRNVPNDGVVNVTTKIEAAEPSPPCKPTPCSPCPTKTAGSSLLIGMVGIGGVAGIGFKPRRRKEKKAQDKEK